MNNDVKVEDNALDEKPCSVKRRYDVPKILSSLKLEAVATTCGKASSSDPIYGDCTSNAGGITS